MAVGADHLALCDLVEDAPPAPVGERGGDVEGLVSEVVELEDDRVGLAAVDAGVGAEVLDEIRRALERKLLLPAAGLIHVALFIRQVVLAFVGRSTLAAHVVALTATLPPPIELAERLDLAAATASSPAIGRRNAHTNTCSHQRRTPEPVKPSVPHEPSQRFGFSTIICSSCSSVIPRSFSSGMTRSNRKVIDQSGTSFAFR